LGEASRAASSSGSDKASGGKAPAVKQNRRRLQRGRESQGFSNIVAPRGFQM
jgi:hypothetical protein